jgi:type IV pilus assembly protein PilC
VKVVPTLAQTFKEMGAELPYSTQVVIGISDFMTQYSLFAALATFAIIGGIVTASRTVRGKRVIDAGLLKMPVIGNIVREVNAARTARTLASLLSSGVDILTALGIVGEVVQNSYFRDVIEEAKGAVGRGEPLSATFSRNEHLYPAFVGEMAAVGEETGQITDMLQRLAGFYEDEVDRTTRDMSTIIEPFLMVIIGAAVGFFAVSMISPIYQLSQNI